LQDIASAHAERIAKLLAKKDAEKDAERAQYQQQTIAKIEYFSAELKSVKKQLEEANTARAVVAKAHESGKKRVSEAVKEALGYQAKIQELEEAIRQLKETQKAAEKAAEEKVIETKMAAEEARETAEEVGKYKQAAEDAIQKAAELTQKCEAAVTKESRLRGLLEAAKTEIEQTKQALEVAKSELAAEKASSAEKVGIDCKRTAEAQRAAVTSALEAQQKKLTAENAITLAEKASELSTVQSLYEEAVEKIRKIEMQGANEAGEQQKRELDALREKVASLEKERKTVHKQEQVITWQF
jgi:hypothetical protein